MSQAEIDDENPNNDRELIQEFLSYTMAVQDRLADMESNNQLMQDRVQQLIQDKRSQQNQKVIQDEISALITENQAHQNQIKQNLQLMTDDIKDSKENPNTKDEPETRVKQTVHRSIASKFRDVLRHT